MNADYYRQERTKTVVRHVVQTPVNWVDLQKLMRIAFRDAGYTGDREPPDDVFWWETEDDELALCCELVSGSNGGPSNSEPIR